MLTLYHAHHSTCSQKVRLCLAEKGLDFESRLLDLAARDQLAPDYLEINPNGVVPTLLHDGQAILDSSVICEYLDDVFADPPLAPAAPVERARMRAWLRYLEEVPTAAVRYPSFNMAFLPRFAGLDDERFLREQADVRPLRKQFYRRMTRRGFKEADIEAALDQIVQAAARMDRALASGPWLVGDAYSLADIVAAPSLDRMADLGLSHLWDRDFPRVADWFERIRNRPAYAAAFYPGSRLTETLDIVPRPREAGGNV